MKKLLFNLTSNFFQFGTRWLLNFWVIYVLSVKSSGYFGLAYALIIIFTTVISYGGSIGITHEVAKGNKRVLHDYSKFCFFIYIFLALTFLLFNYFFNFVISHHVIIYCLLSIFVGWKNLLNSAYLRGLGYFGLESLTGFLSLITLSCAFLFYKASFTDFTDFLALYLLTQTTGLIVSEITLSFFCEPINPLRKFCDFYKNNFQYALNESLNITYFNFISLAVPLLVGVAEFGEFRKILVVLMPVVVMSQVVAQVTQPLLSGKKNPVKYIFSCLKEINYNIIFLVILLVLFVWFYSLFLFELINDTLPLYIILSSILLILSYFIRTASSILLASLTAIGQQNIRNKLIVKSYLVGSTIMVMFGVFFGTIGICIGMLIGYILILYLSALKLVTLNDN